MTRTLTAVLAVVALSAPLFAQATTTSDPKIDTSKLETLLKPMEKDALVIEADGWKGLVAEKNKEAAKLAARDDHDPDDVYAIERDRDQRIARLRIVLSALEAKGGDVSAYETFIDQNDDTNIDKKSLAGIWAYVKNWVTDPEGGIKWGLRIVLFFFILFISRIVSNILGNIVARALKASKGLKTSDLLRDFFINTVKKVVFFIGLIIALGTVGFDIGPFLAGLGVMGFVIGFALQGTLSNFASGIMILLYRPYDIGNVISAAGVTGKVTAMSLVSTTLLTPDNQINVIPNGSIWGGVITNITGNSTRRVDLVFGIGYDDDIEKAEKVLAEIVTSHPKVLKDPAPVIKLHELADSSVNFVCRPWSKTSDYWDVYWDLTREVKMRFDKEGISIPYPQNDTHLHGLEGLMKSA